MAEPFPVRIVRYMLILLAISVYLPWLVWIFCGWIADKRGQRRRA